MSYHLMATRNTHHLRNNEKHFLKCTDIAELQLVTQDFTFFRIRTVRPKSGRKLKNSCCGLPENPWGPCAWITRHGVPWEKADQID